MTPRIYFATPLEQTYSFYLAQQVFGVVLPISGSIRLEIYLNISGRNAVQFLTQSNVDRSILRALWAVADPSNVGSLTDLYQFQLLLRLVSLAQAGSILPPPSLQQQQHPQQQGGDDDHLSLERLRALVQQTAHQQLNLPIFANVMVPSPDQLTLMYGYLVENSAAAVPVGGAPLTLPPVQIQSIEDAFGGLVEVEDAPLGGLVDVAAAAAAVIEPEVPMEDDFGGFEQATPSIEAPLQQDAPVETGAFKNNFMDDAAASGDGDGGGSVPGHVPRISQMSGVSGLSDAFSSGEMMADDNCEATMPENLAGTWTSPTEAFSNMGSAVNVAPLPAVTTNGGGEDDGDDEFEGFESATSFATTPAPASASFGDVLGNHSSDVDNNATAFGAAAMSMSTAATGTIETAATTVTTTTAMDIADAFGDVTRAVQDAPLPALDAFSCTVSAPASAPVPQELMGDFVGAAPVTATVSDDDTNDEDDEFGDFGSATQTSTAIGSLSNDFAGAPTSGVDEFGDFGSSAQPTSSVGSSSNNDAGSTTLAVQPFVTDTSRSASEPIQPSVFDTANDGFSSSVPSVTSAGRSLSVADAFVDIAPPVSEQVQAMPEAIPGMGPSLSISDAFGSNMPEIQEAPLPDLGSFGAVPAPISQEGTNGVATNDMVDDDFGGFEAAPSSVDEEHDVFGGFEVASPAQVQLEEPDYFGTDATNPPAVTDFGRSASEPQSLVAPSPYATEAGRSISLSDAFGATATEQEDLFGDFTSTQANAPAENQDEFAAFESAPATVDQGADLLGNTLPTQDQQRDELFGDFHSTQSLTNDSGIVNEGTLEPDASAAFESDTPATNVKDFTVDPQVTSTHAGDAVGTLDSAPSAPAQSVKQNDQIEPSGADQRSGFAAFELVTPSVATEDITGTAPLQYDADLFGDFGGSVNEATNPTEIAEDGFNAFESTTTHAPATNMPASSKLHQEDEEFGDFSAFEEATPVEPTASKSQDDVFGSLNAPSPKEKNGVTGTTDNIISDSPFRNCTQLQSGEQPISAQSDDGTHQTADDDFADFGDFEQFVPAQSKQATITTTVPSGSGEGEGEDEGDWGDFENVSAPSTEGNEPAEELRFRDRIQSLSLQLPESLLRKSGFSGDHVDLGEVFEANVGVESSLDKASRDRVERCIQVLRSVSQDHRKLASTYWIQIFDVVNEELEVAKVVLSEVGALSAAELKQVMGALRTMLAGLTEYMRISRSIVATVGDILLLDTAAMLTIDTWASTWCSLSILEPALEAEKRWKAIHKLLLPELKSDFKVAVTLQEIRLRNTGATNGKFCHLTLQPLWEQDKATTRAEVAWQGQAFMACSANFLANRCPFFVVED